jgi:hypothetical protein
LSELNGVPGDDPLIQDLIEELELGIREENEGGKATWLECFSTRNQLWKRTGNGMMYVQAGEILCVVILIFPGLPKPAIHTTIEWTELLLYV